MTDLDKSLNEVIEKLQNEECVKEYFRLKKIIYNDDELKKLDELIRFHQKRMCKFENDDAIYFKEKELYETLLKELESNPIYQNFLEVKKEVNSLLIDMRDFLG